MVPAAASMNSEVEAERAVMVAVAVMEALAAVAAAAPPSASTAKTLPIPSSTSGDSTSVLAEWAEAAVETTAKMDGVQPYIERLGESAQSRADTNDWKT